MMIKLSCIAAVLALSACGIPPSDPTISDKNWPYERGLTQSCDRRFESVEINLACAHGRGVFGPMVLPVEEFAQ